MVTPPNEPPRRARAPRAQGRATMLDVAARAGVSLKTVSRVVNHEPNVSTELAERVLEAVSTLGYRHNLAASNLRRGERTASIGVLVQDISNEFCAETLRAVEDHARQRGVVVMTASIDEDVRRERALVEGLLARRIDGMVIMPTGPDLSWLEPELALGIPVVCLDRLPTTPSLDAVLTDHRAAARDAVEHLVRHGHRRIAYLGDDPRIATARERQAGYRLALGTPGVPVDPDLEVVGLRTREGARTALARLLATDDPPTAVFAARNTVCEGAILALQEARRSDQVALVGIDEISVADLVQPRVTVVRQDTRRIGVRTVDLLTARLDGDDSPPRVDLVPHELVVRGSGEIAGPFSGSAGGSGEPSAPRAAVG